MPSRARLASLGLTEWYELGNSVVVTNDIADANVTGAKLKDVFTANIIESGNTTTGNVYFSNTRAVGALRAGNGIIIQANGLIQTDLSNSDVLVLIGSSVLSNLVNATNVIAIANLYAPGDVTLGNVNITGSFDITLSTSNVSEGSNLYFTNNRAVGAFTAGDGVTIEANGLISSPSIFTGNTDVVPEGTSNLYFTNTRAIDALTAGENIAVDSNGLISVNTTPTFGDTTVSGDLTVTGNILLLGNATTIETTTLEIDDPIVHIASNNEISDSVDFGWLGHYSPDSGTTKQHAGVFRKHGSNSFYIFSQYIDDNLDSGNTVTNIDIANATFVLANIHGHTFVGDLAGNVIGMTTDAVIEGSNLYFTNTRAIDALTAGDGIVIEANGLVIATANTTALNANAATFDELTANILIVNGSGDSYLNGIANVYAAEFYGNITSNIISGEELYVKNQAGNVYGLITPVSQGGFDDLLIAGYPGHDIYLLPDDGNGRVYIDGDLEVVGNVTLNLTTDDIAEGSNLYFTNTRAIGSLTAGENIVIESNGMIIGAVQEFTGNTDVVPEGTANLYFTNARALAAIVDNIDTSNVAEGSNLYFTNTRAVGSLTAGTGIVIESNGLIASYSTGTAVFLSSETLVGDGTSTNFIMGASVAQPENIFVIVNGVTQIPGVDYNVSNATLSFSTAPVDSSNIEIRFLGNGEAVIDSRGYFSKSIDEAVGYAVTSINAPALTVPSNVRIILHSIYVTNIDDSLSGNVAVTASVDQYNNGSPDPNTNVYIANVLPIDHRMSVELLKKPQVLNAGDKISMRGFKDGAGANANVHAYLTYETRSDVGYFGTGVNLGDTNDHMLFDSGGNKATIENVRLANYGGGPAAATVRWTNSSNVTQAYFCYNFVVPANTTVELLENPKLIPQSGRILVSASAPNAIAVSVSGRRH